MAGLQPASEITLYNGELAANAVAVFVSGSLYTAFGPEYAALIGIEVGDGQRVNVHTLGGVRDIFFFQLEIQLREAGQRFGAQIGFFEGHVARNILGRSVVFSAFEIGFRESTQSIHLRPEVFPQF
jgi:hypothetical protein